MRTAWTLADDKNDALVQAYFGATGRDMKHPSELMKKYLSRNADGAEAFLRRASGADGLALSERVWRYAHDYRTEIEAGLELGLREGLSANQTARELKKYLRHPDKLFRRVRDAQGKLRLSKPAKAFHPGRGVYRSSFQNARRLVATETNMAYRTADEERWKAMDFVLGYEVKLSNNHTLGGRPFTDICDDLQGKYPKDFKFVGWHPLCRCYAVPILEDEDHFFARSFGNGNEAPEPIQATPENFNDWVKDNADRIASADRHPYFIKDNRTILPEKLRRAVNFAEYSELKAKGFHGYFADAKTGGTLIAHPARYAKGHTNKQERSKYAKEIRMGRVFARNGHAVVMNEEKTGIPTPDVLLDGRPADFKSVTSHNHIVKHAKRATRTQGAEFVLFEFAKRSEKIEQELDKIRRAGIKVKYYYKGENIIHG